MCNLYSLNKKRDMIARMFRVMHNRAAAYEPLLAIFPNYVAPVVRQTDDGEREITLMSWGFVSGGSKGLGCGPDSTQRHPGPNLSHAGAGPIADGRPD